MKLIFHIAAVMALAAPSFAQDTDVLTPSGDVAPIRAVKLIQAGGEAAALERVFFGQVAARETVDLSFEVGGRLTMFDAQEGQFLDQGVQIAAMDLAPFERAVERATLQLAQANRDLTRAQTLVQSNAASATQAENAETVRDLAAVSLREATDALADATLAAPFRALVASRLTPNFANVTPGQPIVRLHDMSEVRVEIDVPERLFQSLSDVDAISFVGTSPLFKGEVPVTARLAPTDGKAIELSPSAVSIGEDGAQVMVYIPNTDGENGTVNWASVEVESSNGTSITVTGLDPTSLVVGAGIQMLREGETVRPFTGLSVE